jgi:hypothetical protein
VHPERPTGDLVDVCVRHGVGGDVAEVAERVCLVLVRLVGHRVAPQLLRERSGLPVVQHVRPGVGLVVEALVEAEEKNSSMSPCWVAKAVSALMRIDDSSPVMLPTLSDRPPVSRLSSSAVSSEIGPRYFSYLAMYGSRAAYTSSRNPRTVTSMLDTGMCSPRRLSRKSGRKKNRSGPIAPRAAKFGWLRMSSASSAASGPDHCGSIRSLPTIRKPRSSAAAACRDALM